MTRVPQRRREDRVRAEAEQKIRGVNRLWVVGFVALVAFTAAGLYSQEQQDIRRLERLANGGAQLRYASDIRQCERVQRLRQEVNDLVQANRRIAAAGQRQTPPGSPLANEFRRLLAQLEVQAATDCRAVVPGPIVVDVD